MKKIFLLIISLISFVSFAQETSFKSKAVTIKRSAIVDLSKIENDFFPVLQKLEAPSPNGESYRSYLANVKEKRKNEPLKNLPNAHKAVLGEQPQPIIASGFESNIAPAGRPNDNDMAISDDGWLISVINSNIHIENIDEVNGEITQISLTYFAEALGNYNQAYDPKVEYDPVSDRFALCFLNGYTANNTNIVIGVSLSGNPNGLWFLYEIEGNPFEADDIWSDYPMIAFSEEEIFITINLIKEGVSWQEGFTQTLIWQIDKQSIYSGSDMESRMWYDINFGDNPIRNIIPVEGGFYSKTGTQYFLSNRNFAEENDTIFILSINGMYDDENTALNVKYGLTDLPYTMPPNGRQALNKQLQTNDARILGACYEIGKIHFVNNSKNPETGFVEVYHGIINDPASEVPTINGTFIGDGIHDFAYPNLAFSGQQAQDEQYIIAFSYSKPDDFPGTAAIFYQEGEYSDVIFIKEGLGVITYPGGNNQYRWGDYSGIQYRYNQPGAVWLSNTFGGEDGEGRTWVAQLYSPDQSGEFVETNTENITTFELNNKIAPNPINDIFSVEFEAPASNAYSMQLFDAAGKKVKTLLNAKAKQGKNRFIFSTNPLTSGMYILKVVNLENTEYSFEEKIMVLGN